MTRSPFKIFGVLAVAASAILVSVPAANAAPRDGRCDAGEVCFYFNSNQQGALSDFTTSVSDYGTNKTTCYVFKGSGSGVGTCIKNQVASVWNRSGQTVTVFYNSGFTGKTQQIAPGAKANLNASLKNNNASHRFESTPQAVSFAAPVPSSARMSSGFGRYPSGGKHNAIDYAYRGNAMSACSGTVSEIKVNGTYANRNAKGVKGSTNYLWIRCDNGVYMGYAHFYANQLPAWLKASKARVKAGQVLFPIGNQGNSSGYHLHFQVEPTRGTPVDGHKYLQSKGVKGLPAYIR